MANLPEFELEARKVTLTPINEAITLLDDNGEATCYIVRGTKGALIIDTANGYANIADTFDQVGPHYLGKTTAVGIYPQGVSPYGVADLSGNVSEWCLNEYESGRTDLGSRADRVLRGGSWIGAHILAAAPVRSKGSPDCRFDIYGFRVCAVLPPP